MAKEGKAFPELLFPARCGFGRARGWELSRPCPALGAPAGHSPSLLSAALPGAKRVPSFSSCPAAHRRGSAGASAAPPRALSCCPELLLLPSTIGCIPATFGVQKDSKGRRCAETPLKASNCLRDIETLRGVVTGTKAKSFFCEGKGKLQTPVLNLSLSLMLH